ncbi:MAG TPA: MarR family transcriptional regulator [Trebonia sp.]|jgi:predicted transcriptional regulator|nr:MarR family transcriptional regulator [Trebonia sp.]
MTADGRDQGDQQAAREGLPEFIERFAAVLVTVGFPPMPARVFVALLVSPDGRLSSAELVEQLQISPAAVSGAVQYLTGLRLVHKERVPGSRREYYRMPPDIWHQVMTMRSQLLVQWTALLKEGMELVGRDTAAGERMADHAAYFEFLTTEMPALFARWEASRRSDSSG